MRTITLFIVLFIVVIAAMMFTANGLFSQPGYVLVAFKSHVFETSFAAAVTWVVVAAVLFVVFGEVIRRSLSSRYGPRYWWSNRGVVKARAQTSQGLLALARGDYTKAQKCLFQGAAHSETQLINYLNAAKAANSMDEVDDRDRYLALAEGLYEDPTAVDLTRARLQFEQKQWEPCIVTLRGLKESMPKNKEILSLLLHAYAEIGAWQSLAELLPQVKKQRVLKIGEIHDLEVKMFCSSLNVINSSDDLVGDKVEQVSALWQSLSKTLKKDEMIVRAYCNSLLGLNETEMAQHTIESAVKHNWSELLVGLYGNIDDAAGEDRLIQGQKWLKNYPNSAALLCSLGKISLQLGSYDQAKTYLESSLEQRESKEVNVALGRLFASTDDFEASNRHLLAALG